MRRVQCVLVLAVLTLALAACTVFALTSKSVEVPNVRGMMYSAAEAKLTAAGLRYREHINADGLGPRGDVSAAEVFKQAPTAGSKVPRGTTVDIWFQIYE